MNVTRWLVVAAVAAGCGGGGHDAGTDADGSGPPTHVAFVVQPSDTAEGVAIAPPIQLAVEDAQGHTVTTATASVTIAIATNPSGGALAGTTTASAVGGIATFSDLSIDKVGAGYTLAASTSGLTGDVSNPFSVNPALYVAQAGTGTGTGGCGNAAPVAYFNTAANWSDTPTSPTQIGPGTFVFLCGTIATRLTIGGSGTTAQPITVACAPNAGCALSQPAGMAVDLGGQGNLILDGGHACGPAVDESTCTGIMENTGNGTGRASRAGGQAIFATGASGSIEIRNWLIRDFYVHAPPAPITSISCDGSQCTVTMPSPPPYAAGETGVYIAGNSLAAFGAAYTATTVSGNTFTFTPSGTVPTGTGTGGETSDGGIDQTLSNVLYANGTSANISFHDNTIHDVGWAILVANAGGSSSLDVHDVSFYNYDHGVVPAVPTATIHDNHIGSTHSWDTVNNEYHHDGIHCFGNGNSGACTTSLLIYNNLYDGDWGGNPTAHNYFEASPQTLQVYNNIHIQYPGNYVPDGMDSLAMVHGTIVNNTYVCDPSVANAAALNVGGADVAIENNVFTGCNSFWSAPGAGTVLSPVDYNAYMQQGAGGNSAWGGPTGGVAAASGQSGFVNITGMQATPTNYPLFTLANYMGPITINGTVYTAASLTGGTMTLTTTVAGSQTNAPYTLAGIDEWRWTTSGEQHSSYATTDTLDTMGKPDASSPVLGAGSNLSALCATLTALCETSSAGGTIAPHARAAGAAWDIGAY